MLAPLLAVPPALAGIGAATVRRPLGYGAVSLLAAIAIAAKPTAYAGWLPGATIFTVVVITAVATAGTAISVRQERRIAEVRSVAEAAQRAVLRPPPPRLGPLGFDVVYVAAAAEAKVGGDLYEAVATSRARHPGDHGRRAGQGPRRGRARDRRARHVPRASARRVHARRPGDPPGRGARPGPGQARGVRHRAARRDRPGVGPDLDLQLRSPGAAADPGGSATTPRPGA